MSLTFFGICKLALALPESLSCPRAIMTAVNTALHLRSNERIQLSVGDDVYQI